MGEVRRSMFIKTKEDAQRILDTLRWREDMIVMNYNGSLVWLDPCYDEEGKRIGITDCCFVVQPCDHHRALQQKEDNDGKTGSECN